jgi:hypothetical protein
MYTSWFEDILLVLLLALFAFSISAIGCGRKTKNETKNKFSTVNEPKVSTEPNQKNNKPEKLPAYADPNEPEMDTFYAIKSSLAFPAKNPDGTLLNANA